MPNERRGLGHSGTMAPLGTWLRLLVENGGAAPPYWGKLARILLVSSLAAPLRLAERLRFGRAVDRTPIETAPLFVLGAPRSGTTHLHNLLSRDPRFAVVTTFQAVVPTFCLAGGDRLKALMAERLPPRRPMDAMEVSLDLPQEEDLAVANSCSLSLNWALSFPRRARSTFERYSLMRGLTERELKRWERAYMRVLRKATLIAGGGRLLLKSPANTSRTLHLLSLFPEAKFVHIVRDPYVVFASLQHLFRTVAPRQQLQPVTDEELVELAEVIYREMMRQYLRDRGSVPDGQLAEVRFEDLEQDPLGTLARIYDELRLPGWSAARPRVQDYVDSLSAYRKNRYELDADLVSRVQREFGFVLEEWPYAAPDLGPGRAPAPA